MAQKSYLWPSDLIGDGQMVTQNDWPAMWGALMAYFTGSAAIGGILSDQRGATYRLQDFQVSDAIYLYPGQALVGGQFYSNDIYTAVILDGLWPSFGDYLTHDMDLQLQALWSQRDVRARAENGTDGGVIGNKANYQLGVANYRFGPGDSNPLFFFWTTRAPEEYVANNSQILLHRQGGSATSWTLQGTNNYMIEKQAVCITAAYKAYVSGTFGSIGLDPAYHPKNAAMAITILNSGALATLSFYLRHDGDFWWIEWANSVSDQPEFHVISLFEKTL